MDYMNHLYGRDKKIIKDLSHGLIHEYAKEKKKYVVTEYEIFKGVRVFYNDIHTNQIIKETSIDNNNTYEINHCREGRFECILKDGTITYMEAGDFAINLTKNSSIESFFPISHYHGVAFIINPDEFDEEINILEKMYHINYENILNNLCSDDKLFLKRATEEINHIFLEMYRVPDDIIISYLKVKFQELFIYLSIVDKNVSFNEREYFAKSNIEIIKNINELITHDFNSNYTYEALSKMYDIKITTMKNCYKSVYGQSINDTIKKNKLEQAAYLLKTTSLTITNIAFEIGYADHSKFSKAFKRMYNITPTEYRKITKGTQRV